MLSGQGSEDRQDYKVERYIRFEVKESRTTAKNIWSGVVLILTVHIK
jgi:hypothetical protein